MKRLVSMMFLAAALTSTTWADAVLDFGTNLAGVGGTISWAGGSAPLVGSGILLGAVTASGAGANNGIHRITGTPCSGILNLSGGCATLSFTTGSFSGYDATGNMLFNGGGSFTITGGLPDAGIAAGTTLVSGTFNSPVAYLTFGSLLGSGTDTKNATMISYFGLAGLPFDFAGFSITLSAIPAFNADAFSATAVSTDFKNTQVPEPASILLLGTVLVGVTQIVRRQLSRQA